MSWYLDAGNPSLCLTLDTADWPWPAGLNTAAAAVVVVVVVGCGGGNRELHRSPGTYIPEPGDNNTTSPHLHLPTSASCFHYITLANVVATATSVLRDKWHVTCDAVSQCHNWPDRTPQTGHSARMFPVSCFYILSTQTMFSRYLIFVSHAMFAHA